MLMTVVSAVMSEVCNCCGLLRSVKSNRKKCTATLLHCVHIVITRVIFVPDQNRWPIFSTGLTKERLIEGPTEFIFPIRNGVLYRFHISRRENGSPDAHVSLFKTPVRQNSVERV